MDKLKELATMKNVFIVALIAIILILGTCSGPKEKVVTVVQPEYTKVTDTVFIEKIKLKTIVVKDGTVVVNKEKYNDYIKEKDTVKKKDQFVNSITIRDYNTKVIDNDTVSVEVYSKVQGELIAVNAKVKVKQQEIKERIITQRPKLSILVGAEVGYQNFEFNPLIKTGIQTKSGNIYTASIDLNKNVYVGFSKTFTLFK
jgi:hypothetical protein